MKIGIFLGYSHKTTLSTEGLGRLLGKMCEAFLKGSNSLVIACPNWLTPKLEELFNDMKIDTKNMSLVTVKSPALLFIASLYEKFHVQKKRRDKKGLRNIAGSALFEFTANMLSMGNAFAFCLIAIMLFVLAIVLLPVAIILLLLYLLFYMSRFIIRTPKNAILKQLSIASALNVIKYIFNFSGSFVDNFASKIYERVHSKTMERLAIKINHTCCADVWLATNLLWPAFDSIKVTKVRVAPDLVTVPFAEGFSILAPAKYTDDIKKTIQNGQYFITYSCFIRDTLLVNDFGKKCGALRVIPHANNNLLHHIDIYSNTRHLKYPSHVNVKYARFLTYMSGISQREYPWGWVNDYMCCLKWEDTRYIFYASQNRPSKNIVSLIKAYEYVLRRKYKQVKLVLTANPMGHIPVYNYVTEKNLQFDVIFMHGVSEAQLAGLYAGAELVVNPTLYEGGFPFTFAEGMSVGTPSVMGRIPQTLEGFEGYDCDEFLFDPHDWLDIADKICFGLDNREYLHDKQLPIYEKMNKRTWETVANEYVDAFKYFMNMDVEKTRDARSTLNNE